MKVHESTRANLAHQVLLLRHNCWATSFGSNSAEVMKDEAPVMQTNAPETQGVILGESTIKSYKHDNVIEQSGNTTNTILLDVISESLQICDFTFLYGLVESHAHTSDFFEVFPLTVDSSCLKARRWQKQWWRREETPCWWHRNCTIGFIHLWVLFLFLLVLYFRMLHGIANWNTCFEDCVIFLCDIRGSFRFGRIFSHSSPMTIWVAVTTRTWLDVKNHPPIRDHHQVDQNSHVSHLFIYGICNLCTRFIASLQALHHLLLFGEQHQESSEVSFKLISNLHHWHLDI